MKSVFKPVAALLMLGLLGGCDNNTPLMTKVLEQDTAAVEATLTAGGDIDARNSYGWTALTHAARLGHTDIMRLLIKNGADVNAVDDTSWSPLLRTAMKGHADAAQLLLEHGADITHKDNNGWTALHWAAQSDSSRIMKMLIEKGADLNATTEDGWTPRMVAQNEGNVELVNLINRWMKQAGTASPLDKKIYKKEEE